jgi:hypothetical protein
MDITSHPLSISVLLFGQTREFMMAHASAGRRKPSYATRFVDAVFWVGAGVMLFLFLLFVIIFIGYNIHLITK